MKDCRRSDTSVSAERFPVAEGSKRIQCQEVGTAGATHQWQMRRSQPPPRKLEGLPRTCQRGSKGPVAAVFWRSQSRDALYRGGVWHATPRPIVAASQVETPLPNRSRAGNPADTRPAHVARPRSSRAHRTVLLSEQAEHPRSRSRGWHQSCIYRSKDPCLRELASYCSGGE